MNEKESDMRMSLGVFLIMTVVSNYPHATVRAFEALDISHAFTPSGWMGDGMAGTKFVELNEAWVHEFVTPPTAIRLEYRPGIQRWAGIYWQNRPDNWGEMEGEDLRDQGFTKITFWARGERGGEVVEFKSGGIEAVGRKFKDSYSATSGTIILEPEWHEYSIDLSGKDLSSVIGGFAWVAAGSANPDGLTFYLDDIKFE
jgi:hypothetical protein